MNNPQILADRIKSRTSEIGISAVSLLQSVGIKDKNFINKIENGTNVGYINIVKIADALDCSIDYLMGRTDEVSLNKGTVIQAGDVSGNIITGDINGNHNANINAMIPEEFSEIIELIRDLPLVKRAEAIIMLNNMKSEG